LAKNHPKQTKNNPMFLGGYAHDGTQRNVQHMGLIVQRIKHVPDIIPLVVFFAYREAKGYMINNSGKKCPLSYTPRELLSTYKLCE
jgi:hypothetical protein